MSTIRIYASIYIYINARMTLEWREREADEDGGGTGACVFKALT